VIPDLEPENPYSAKRQRLSERQIQSPILEPASTPNSTPMLELSGQVSRPGVSADPIPGPLGSGHKGDGVVSLVLPLADLRDEEGDEDTYVQGTVEELLQSIGSVRPFEGTKGERVADRTSDKRKINRQESDTIVGENSKDELSHNNEVCSVPPAKPRRRRRKDWAPERRRGLSNTALRPLDCNTAPTKAQQQVRSSQPQQKFMLTQARTNRGPQSCSSRSSSPVTPASDRTNIKYGASIDMACQITDLTHCAIPNGSSIVTAIVRYRDSNWSLNPVALGHKFLGEQGKVIRMTQLSPDSWVLLGYRYDDGALGLCNHESLNAEWINSSHRDAAGHRTDHSDDDWDEKGENEEGGAEEHSRRTHKPWLESDEVFSLSLKDKQNMGWKEICKRFPGRSPGAVKVRYYMLHKTE
jgi:hypothetical protein